VKHYVLIQQDTRSEVTVIGVFHGPTLPITRARELATSACTNSDCYEEKVSAGREIFRATYGVEGECYRVEGVAHLPAVVECGAPAPAPKPPLKARAWLLETLQDLLNGDWELVTAVGERDHVFRANPDSPFLGRFPGPNMYYSLHLRLNEEARARMEVSLDDIDRVRASLENDP
jgi:hypothetical protein